jgi:hypothetical protein
MSRKSHDPGKTCPNRAIHTPHPTGYLAYGEWAEKMLAKGYRAGEVLRVRSLRDMAPSGRVGGA